MAGLRIVSDKVALVTGASSGIGAAFARELARRGARVALVARREDRLERQCREISEAGGQASVHVCDVSDPDAVERAWAEITDRWGPVDLLINNAGHGRHILFEHHSTDDIERMMRSNYMGTVYWIKRVLPGMKERGHGWIVNISSFAGKLGQADEAAYSASKSAVTALSQGLAQEFAPLGIHVLCLHPTLVETEMFTPEVMARMPRTLGKRFIAPSEFVGQALDVLAKGRTEAVIPRRMRLPILLYELFPTLMGRTVGRVKLAALPE
jgi:short-subunit dehydrogenase